MAPPHCSIKQGTDLMLSPSFQGFFPDQALSAALLSELPVTLVFVHRFFAPVGIRCNADQLPECDSRKRIGSFSRSVYEYICYMYIKIKLAKPG